MGLPLNGKKNWNDLLVVLSILLYTIVLSSYTLFKHYSFSTYAWDLGLFNQAFWSTAFADKIFFYTCELHLVESGSFFGVHFSPILFSILPIYFLRPDASTLLILQSFLLGLSALPIYKLAQTRFTERQSVLLSSVYLLNPALHGINCYDFHVQAFLPLILAYLLYYIEIDNAKGSLIATNLALAVQEQVFYIVLAFLAFYLLRKKPELSFTDTNKRTFMIAGLILLSAIIWRTASSAVISYYNPQIPEHLRAGQHYLALGVDDPAKIPLHLLRNHGSIVNALVYEWYNKLFYLFCLFPHTCSS